MQKLEEAISVAT